MPRTSVAVLPARCTLWIALALGLGACSQTPAPSVVSTPNTAGSTGPNAPAVTAVGPSSSASPGGLPGSPYDGIDRSWTATPDNSGPLLKTLALGAGDNPLSNENWVSASSGWGPIERNRSNGESTAGDGKTLTLNGVAYTSGIGVHANSQMTFALSPTCTTFSTDIGLDDEVGTKGSAVFQVFADGVKLYDSGVMTGQSATKSVNVNVSGRSTLQLVVIDGGDNNYYDHADWAGAKLVACGVTPTSNPIPAYKGPLVITKGGIYSGSYESTSLNTPAVTIQTREPVIIENMNLRGPGDLISGFWVNLTVRNTRGYGINPNISGAHKGRFISAQDIVNLDVQNNYLEGTTGIYANVFQGQTALGQSIKIVRNKVKNIDGRLSNGQNGYQNDRYRVQFVQLSKIRSVSGVEIAWNEVVNEPGNSSLEENINLYTSSGTANSPIKIHDNYIQGAYAIFPSTDAVYSGGGILLGDGEVNNLSTAGGFADVYNNQILDTSNQGVGIAGGHDHRVYGNRVLSSGRLADSSVVAAQNVGIYVWDLLGGSKYGTFFSNTVYDNLIGWTRVDAGGRSWLNNTWFPNCSALCTNNSFVPGPLPVSVTQTEYQTWLGKTQGAGVKIGPS